MSPINAGAKAIIDRLRAIPWAKPAGVDVARLQRCFDAHLTALGMKPRPVTVIAEGNKAAILLVFSRAEAAYRAAEAPGKSAAAWAAARDAARDAAWDAAWIAARAAAWAAARDEADLPGKSAAAWDAAWDKSGAAWVAAWDAAWAEADLPGKSAAACAARAAAWAAARDAALLNCCKEGERRPAAVTRWLEASAPLLDAVEAGADIFWIGEREIFVSVRPAYHIDDRNRLHNPTGPAVQWISPDGERYWFWHGVRVPQHVIEDPSKITAGEITSETNAEVRRVMIERFGAERYISDSGAEVLNQDGYGTLFRKRIPDDEDLVMVKVKNSTPEPDGSIKDYYLRVPPAMRTAHEAVAWTFGLTTQTYHPRVQT